MSVQLLTEEQAAAKMQISIRQLKRLREKGKFQKGIHYQKLGGAVRYIEATLDNLILNWDDEAEHLRFVEAWRKQQTGKQAGGNVANPTIPATGPDP